MERNCYLRNCAQLFFLLIVDIFEALEGLEGLKLDEIEAANSFPMLPMARNGLKWPVMSPSVPYFPHIFPRNFQYLSIYHIPSCLLGQYSFGPRGVQRLKMVRASTK